MADGADIKRSQRAAELTYRKNREGRQLMNNLGKTDSEKKLIKVYIAVEAVILIMIQASKLMQLAHLGWIMYPAIVLNTAVAAYFYARYGRTLRDRHANLIAYALFMTLVADWFLTFTVAKYGGMTYIYGLIAFCTVEILYAAYLRAGLVSILVRALLFLLGLFGLYKAGMLGVDAALGILNMILVMVNVIDAWTARRRDTTLLFRLGITLFLCCDVTVMLMVLTSGSLRETISFMTWIFYVPAQVLLTLSYIEACTDAD